MKRRVALRPDNVMSTLAVFLALAGGSVAIAGVPGSSVSSNEVVDESLRSRDLKDGSAVESSDVVDGELISQDLATNSVSTDEIGTQAVGTSELATGGVESGDIANAAVGGGAIADNSVGSPEIGTGVVGSSEVGLDQIGSSELAPSAVGGPEIANGSVTATEIGADNFYRDVDGLEGFDSQDNPQNGDYQLTDHASGCDPAGGELIAGSAKWDDADQEPLEDELFISEIRLNLNTDTVTVLGGSDAGFRFLRAEAICLSH